MAVRCLTSLFSLRGDRRSRNVQGKDALRERERACAQTSQVSLIKECAEVSGSRLGLSSFFSFFCLQIYPRPACCRLFSFSSRFFTLCLITKDKIQSLKINQKKPQNRTKQKKQRHFSHSTSITLYRHITILWFKTGAPHTSMVEFVQAFKLHLLYTLCHWTFRWKTTARCWL